MNMKKLWLTIFIFIFLLAGQKTKLNFSLQSYFEGEYCAYVETNEFGGTNLGVCYMTRNRKVPNKIGESMTIYNFEPISALKTLQATVIKTETLTDGTSVIYAYTDLIDKTVDVEGKKVNLQLACYEDHTVIGWPLILGSF